MSCQEIIYYRIHLVPIDFAHQDGTIQGKACLETLERYPPIDIYHFKKGSNITYSLNNWLNQIVDLHYLEVYSSSSGTTKVQRNASAKLLYNSSSDTFTLTIDHKKID